MRPTLERALVLLLLVAGLAACATTIDPELRLNFYGEDIHPGPHVGCPSRCDEMKAEVGRWVDGRLDDVDVLSVTYHTMVRADGSGYNVARSGGSTWMAVATLTDGSRRVLLTGCGVGIDTEMCFASQP